MATEETQLRKKKIEKKDKNIECFLLLDHIPESNDKEIELLHEEH